MKEIVVSLCPYLLLLPVPGIIACIVAIVRDSAETNRETVHNGAALGIVGMAGSLFFGSLTLINFAFASEGDFRILFTVLALLCGLLMPGYFNCRIRYDKEGFTYRDYLGIRHRYEYTEVSGLKVNDHESIIRIGHRRVMVDEIAVGGDRFLRFMQKRHHTLTGGEIPVLLPKLDLYRGHIANGQTLTVVSIVFYVFLVCFTVFLSCIPVLQYDKPETREVRIASVRAPEKRHGDMTMTDTEGREYRLPYELQTDTIDAASLCGGAVTVTGTVFSQKSGDDYFKILTVSCGGRELVTQEQAGGYIRGDMTMGLIIGLVMIALWSLYFIPGIFIGRDPNKHPRLAKLLFEERNVIWD